MFKVPTGSSSPAPATPDRSRTYNSLFSPSNPSTTPAGPPPTSFTAASTTPAGQPPTSLFGTSQYNAAIPFANLHPAQRSSPRSPGQIQANAELDIYDEDADGDYDDEGYDAMEEDAERGDILSIYDSQPTNPAEPSAVSIVARGLTKPTEKLTEPGSLVLQTERALEKVFATMQLHAPALDDIPLLLADTAQQLLHIWHGAADMRNSGPSIGPQQSAPSVTKAYFLASLLLPLHLPSPSASIASFSSSHNAAATTAAPTPEILLKWLRQYHNPFPNDLAEVLSFKPNPTAHDRFWDVIYSALLRGELKNVIDLLQLADFRYASSALDDGAESIGYRGTKLDNTQLVINGLLKVLETSPAVQYGDWNVTSSDWAIFRKRVIQAVADLEYIAEGASQDRGLTQEPFMAENFGNLRDDPMSMSVSSRRAQSQVPWTIYQNLTYLYGQLLGTHAEILAAASDWVEASIGLTVWWNGNDDDEGQENLAASRHSHAPIHSRRRLVDLKPAMAYQNRLAKSLARVTAESDEPELQVNTLDPVQVGLACIMENDVEGAIGIIRSLSATISAGVVELAWLGGWLGDVLTNGTKDVMANFDQSDLLVLSYAQQRAPGLEQQKPRLTRDGVLVHYARILSRQHEIVGQKTSREGWELAIEILARLESLENAQNQIREVLAELDITSSDRASKIIDLCAAMGLPQQAREVAERFADSLSQSTNYGDALYYYARAHAETKLRNVLDVLSTYCLVTSAAYPSANELDSRLGTLIASPRQTIAALKSADREAAELLATHLSGYATIRRFYDLRDGTRTTGPDNSEDSPALTLGRPASRKAAASALVAAISSAADSIHGGLYDASTRSVVPLDVLLVLLGEALPFLSEYNKKDSSRPALVLTQQQCTLLLGAIEDLDTVSAHVFAQCEACLNSSLAQAHGEQVPSPATALLKMSTGGLSESCSGFSLLGASNTFSVAAKDGSNGGNSVFSSGVLVSNPSLKSQDMADSKTSDVNRAWDWRKMPAITRHTSGKEVLRLLRLGLAKEVAKGWISWSS